MSNFSFSVDIIDGRKLIVKPIGSLDFHTVGVLKQAIYPLCVSEEVVDVVFDYEKVDYSDSSAFGLLLKLSRTIDGEVTVINAKPSLKRIFQMAGFDTIFFKGNRDHDFIA